MAIPIKTWQMNPNGAGDILVQVGTVDFDTSKPETLEDAAKSFYNALCAYADREGYTNMDMLLYRDTSGTWVVSWESGPYEWAIHASASVHGPWGYTEPNYSFDLSFVR